MAAYVAIDFFRDIMKDKNRPDDLVWILGCLTWPGSRDWVSDELKYIWIRLEPYLLDIFKDPAKHEGMRWKSEIFYQFFIKRVKVWTNDVRSSQSLGTFSNCSGDVRGVDEVYAHPVIL